MNTSPKLEPQTVYKRWTVSMTNVFAGLLVKHKSERINLTNSFTNTGFRQVEQEMKSKFPGEYQMKKFDIKKLREKLKQMNHEVLIFKKFMLNESMVKWSISEGKLYLGHPSKIEDLKIKNSNDNLHSLSWNNIRRYLSGGCHYIYLHCVEFYIDKEPVKAREIFTNPEMNKAMHYVATPYILQTVDENADEEITILDGEDINEHNISFYSSDEEKSTSSSEQEALDQQPSKKQKPLQKQPLPQQQALKHPQQHKHTQTYAQNLASQQISAQLASQSTPPQQQPPRPPSQQKTLDPAFYTGPLAPQQPYYWDYSMAPVMFPRGSASFDTPMSRFRNSERTSGSLERFWNDPGFIEDSEAGAGPASALGTPPVTAEEQRTVDSNGALNVDQMKPPVQLGQAYNPQISSMMMMMMDRRRNFDQFNNFLRHLLNMRIITTEDFVELGTRASTNDSLLFYLINEKISFEEKVNFIKDTINGND